MEVEAKEKNLAETTYVPVEQEPTQEVTSKKSVTPKKEPKPINWKEKFVRVIKLVDMTVGRRLDANIPNEDRQLLADEWNDVMNDLNIKLPLIARVILALIITAAIVGDAYGSAIAKFRRKRQDGNTGLPEESSEAKQKA
jgi:hypothetical protein